MSRAKRGTVGALAPWYGSNRSLAHKVGELLTGCAWVGVPFAGGMSELRHIDAPTVAVGDLHRHVINLARVVASDESRDELIRRLDRLPYHPGELADCQAYCREIEIGDDPSSAVDWAECYFVCAWMSRSATAGTDREFDATYSMRWTATGGDSAARFRNATASLAEWSEVMRRCTFVACDVFDFLADVKDAAGHGLYLDSPFPGPGDRYKHTFGEESHRRLAARLAEFKSCKVVCRFYDVGLVRELYPESAWTWHHLDGGKTQANTAAPEVLLVSRGTS